MVNIYWDTQAEAPRSVGSVAYVALWDGMRKMHIYWVFERTAISCHRIRWSLEHYVHNLHNFRENCPGTKNVKKTIIQSDINDILVVFASGHILFHCTLFNKE